MITEEVQEPRVSHSLQRCTARAGCKLCQLSRITEERKRRACLLGRVGWKGKGKASGSISGSNRGTFSPQGSCREEPWHTQSQNADKVAPVRRIRSPVGLARLSLSSTRTACGQMMHHAVIFGGGEINFFSGSLFAFQSALVGRHQRAFINLNAVNW